MKSIIKQLYTILLVTVACLTVTGCSDDFKSGLRLDGDVWVNSIKLDEYAGTIDYQNKTIVVGVPYDYDVTRMAVSEINRLFSSRIFDREEWRRTDELYDYREERRSKDTDL